MRTRHELSCPRIIPGLLVLAVGCVAFPAQADIVLQYTFASDLAATTVDANLSAASTMGGLTDGSYKPLTGQYIYQSTAAAISADGGTYTGSNPLNDILATGGPGGCAWGRRFMTTSGGGFQHYFQFSLTVAEGYALDLESVVFDTGLRSLSSDAIKVEYSPTTDFSAGVVPVGAGAGYVASPQTGLGYGAGGTLGVVKPRVDSSNYISWNRLTNTANLTGNEKLEGTVFFRIWAKGCTGTTGSGQSNIYVDNVTVNGTLAPAAPAGTMILFR